MKHWEWQSLKVFKRVTCSELCMYIFRHVNRRVEVAEVWAIGNVLSCRWKLLEATKGSQIGKCVHSDWQRMHGRRLLGRWEWSVVLIKKSKKNEGEKRPLNLAGRSLMAFERTIVCVIFFSLICKCICVCICIWF